MKAFIFWIKKHAVILIVVAALILVALIAYRYEHSGPNRNLISRYIARIDHIRARGPLTIQDVGMIKPWMTFDYVNKLFAIPPGYLQESEAISDTKYPNITIGHYAAERHTDPMAFNTTVEASVSDYLTTKK